MSEPLFVEICDRCEAPRPIVFWGVLPFAHPTTGAGKFCVGCWEQVVCLAACPLCAFVRTCGVPPADFVATMQARFGFCAVCAETIIAHGAFHPHDREGTCPGFVGTTALEGN